MIIGLRHLVGLLLLQNGDKLSQVLSHGPLPVPASVQLRPLEPLLHRQKHMVLRVCLRQLVHPRQDLIDAVLARFAVVVQGCARLADAVQDFVFLP